MVFLGFLGMELHHRVHHDVPVLDQYMHNTVAAEYPDVIQPGFRYFQ